MLSETERGLLLRPGPAGVNLGRFFPSNPRALRRHSRFAAGAGRLVASVERYSGTVAFAVNREDSASHGLPIARSDLSPTPLFPTGPSTEGGSQEIRFRIRTKSWYVEPLRNALGAVPYTSNPIRS
jgi:hypothetical protein